MSEIIITKQCNKCKISKPLSEFYKDKRLKNGYRTYCKSCMSNNEKQYHQSEKGKMKHRENNRKHRKLYPEQTKAHDALHNAIAYGRFPRANSLKCYYCPKKAEEYHHPNYTKPFEVIPLCKSCHKKLTINS